MHAEAQPDPTEFMRETDPGTVIYGFAADGDDLHIELLVRETSDEIARIPAAPEIQIRAGFREIEGVFVVAVLFRFRSDGPVRVSFWNYHAPVEDPADGNLFDHLAGSGTELIVKLFGDSGRVERLLPFQHPLGTFFRQAIRRIAQLPAWDDDAFREAVWALLDECPEPLALWESMGGA